MSAARGVSVNPGPPLACIAASLQPADGPEIRSPAHLPDIQLRGYGFFTWTLATTWSISAAVSKETTSFHSVAPAQK